MQAASPCRARRWRHPGGAVTASGEDEAGHAGVEKWGGDAAYIEADLYRGRTGRCFQFQHVQSEFLAGTGAPEGVVDEVQCLENLAVDLIAADGVAGDGGQEAGGHIGRVEQAVRECCGKDRLECDDPFTMAIAGPYDKPAQRGDGFRQPVRQPVASEGSARVVKLVKPAIALACEESQPPLPQVVEVVVGELDLVRVAGPFEPQVRECCGDHGEVPGGGERIDPHQERVCLRSGLAAQTFRARTRIRVDAFNRCGGVPSPLPGSSTGWSTSQASSDRRCVSGSAGVRARSVSRNSMIGSVAPGPPRLHIRSYVLARGSRASCSRSRRSQRASSVSSSASAAPAPVAPVPVSRSLTSMMRLRCSQRSAWPSGVSRSPAVNSGGRSAPDRAEPTVSAARHNPRLHITRVLPWHLLDQHRDPGVSRRTPSPPGIGPPPADQPSVPAQQRVRCHQPPPVSRTGEQPGQGRDHRPVRPVQLRPWVLPLQHSDLMRHQELSILRGGRTGEQHQRTGQADEHQVEHAQRHKPTMLPAPTSARTPLPPTSPPDNADGKSAGQSLTAPFWNPTGSNSAEPWPAKAPIARRHLSPSPYHRPSGRPNGSYLTRIGKVTEWSLSLARRLLPLGRVSKVDLRG